MFDDAVRAVAELAASQHGALTRRQAAALKFDRARVANALDRGWLAEPYPGCSCSLARARPGTSDCRSPRCPAAGTAWCPTPPRRGCTLDGFDGVELVELSVTREHRWRLGGRVVAHHVQALEPCDIVDVDGLRCTGLARTLADVGSVCPSPLMVRRALTDVRRRGTSLRWVHDTALRLHRPGQRGTGLLLAQLAAIPHEGRVPDSWLEELLALCLADPTLGPVVPQYPIRRPDGSIVAKTDIGLPDVKLGLEGHSRAVHFGPDAEPLDEQRDLAAAACGWDLEYLGWFAAQRPGRGPATVREIVAVRRAARGVTAVGSSGPAAVTPPGGVGDGQR